MIDYYLNENYVCEFLHISLNRKMYETDFDHLLYFSTLPIVFFLSFSDHLLNKWFQVAQILDFKKVIKVTVKAQIDLC